MNIKQYISYVSNSWTPVLPEKAIDTVQLIMIFGDRERIEEGGLFQLVKSVYPNSHIIGCTTAGEICETNVFDNTLVLTAIEFDDTQLKAAKITLNLAETSYDAGIQLGKSLMADDLKHVFVLSDGLHVNGSKLVDGLSSMLPCHITITGGLSADRDQFQKTLVILDDEPMSSTIAAIGFCGNKLTIGHGCLGGWDSFGPERLVTKSKGNVLFELDGKSALDLYKTYLGGHAKNLPASGLLFPLSVRLNSDETGVVRTILSVDENKQSLTFAGDIPEGSLARLMKANFNRLIDGAAGAATRSCESIKQSKADLAILISCVGRKMVLKQRIEEEIEAVRDVLGSKTVFTGFYSYGEISPFMPNVKCELHNQTMTITTISED